MLDERLIRADATKLDELREIMRVQDHAECLCDIEMKDIKMPFPEQPPEILLVFPGRHGPWCDRVKGTAARLQFLIKARLTSLPGHIYKVEMKPAMIDMIPYLFQIGLRSRQNPLDSQCPFYIYPFQF